MKKILSLFVLGVLPFVSSSQSFINPILDSGITGYSQTPNNWEDVPYTFIYSNASNFGAATVDVCSATWPNNGSSDLRGFPHSGTKFVSGEHGYFDTTFKHEGIQQNVSGFTVGCTYAITFWQAVLLQNSSNSDRSGSWTLFVDNDIIATSAPSTSTILYQDRNLEWEERTLTFTATATSHMIRFLVTDDDSNQASSGGRVRMCIDDLSITSSSVLPSIDTSGPFCSGQTAVNLTATPTGGTWSGPGITDATTGAFDPSVAGVGSHTITYSINAGCASGQDTVVITVTSSSADASWTAPTGLCVSNTPIDLSNFITGTSGGTFSGIGISGTVFDPSVGTQSITYTVGTASCEADLTQTITVTSSAADASWTVPTGLCTFSVPINLSNFITGDPGGTWSGTGIIDANLGRFDPGIAGIGTHNITYTVGTAPCQVVQTNPIAVSTSPDASWTVPTGLCPSSAPIDLSTLITGTAGGTFNGTGISGTLFDPSVGTQSITYGVVSASCEAYETQTITVTSSAANASWTVPTGLCISSAPIDLSTLITGTAGGTFNGMGVSGSMFDPSVGTQSITYTVGTSPCGDTSTQTITVTTSAADASWTVPTGLCPSSAPINLSTFITGNSGGTWSGTGIIDANLGRFDPGIAGIGTHDITYTVGTASCEAFLTQTITISEPGTVTILDIAIQDWSQNNNSITVVMDNPGNYEYSLDDVNYQDSNSFYNLETGDYRVYVKTKEGCGSAEEDIYLLNYPKFFTPNGDGINDTWQIFHSNRELNNRIFIYDRYGKLLTEISPSGPGWDGTYNGASLHSDDYWFVIERTEIGKTFRAHFSLKR